MYKISKLIVITTILFFYVPEGSCQEISEFLFRQIPVRLVKLENKQNCYLDLDKKSILKIERGNSIMDESFSEEPVEIDLKSIKGSLLERGQLNQLLSVCIKYGPWGSAEGESENLIYIFNGRSELDQGPIFNDWFFDSLAIHDLNGDGISELYCEVSWGRMGQECGLLFVYNRKFDKPINQIGLYSNFDNSIIRKYYNVSSEYYFKSNELIVDYQLDYFLRLDENDIGFIKSEEKKNIYRFKGKN